MKQRLKEMEDETNKLTAPSKEEEEAAGAQPRSPPRCPSLWLWPGWRKPPLRPAPPRRAAPRGPGLP